jgi:hypothetical protein
MSVYFDLFSGLFLAPYTSFKAANEVVSDTSEEGVVAYFRTLRQYSATGIERLQLQ